MQKFLFIFTLLLFAANAFSQKNLAVLEINPGSNEVPLAFSEFRHLTDELRTRAREALPRANYNVLTRDNIFQLLPPDEEQAKCLDEACAVQIGRVIGAEYVTQGIVGNFQGMLTLTVELYESMSGNLLGSFVTESEDARGLLGTIRERAPALFSQLSEPKFTELKNLQNEETISISKEELKAEVPHTPNPIPHTQKSNSAFTIALTLDLLGTAAIGFGIYKHMDSNKLYNDYKKKPDDIFYTQKEYEEFQKTKKAELQKVRDAEKLRNIGYAIGGALLTAGIAVHIWF